MAMTDLFISATAALLIVLAVSQPHEPQPLPVQADIIAFCPVEPAENDANTTLSVMFQPAAQPGTEPREVTRFAEMAGLPEALGLDPQPYYSIAVVPDSDGRLTGACFGQVSQGFAREHNAALDQLERNDPMPRAIFVVSLVNAEPTDE